jgi:cytosine/adenosine deaminase-related metal-dependent hydrolase
MLTVNGARAMGLEGQVGMLAVGARADLVLHDARRPEWVPLHNPVQQLVWSADGRGVHSVGRWPPRGRGRTLHHDR